jgi:carbamate kinase
MEDTYVYISVKLNLEAGQTESSIGDIIQEMDYSFEHSDIIDHEIIDILDHQIPDEDDSSFQGSSGYVDPFSLLGFDETN